MPLPSSPTPDLELLPSNLALSNNDPVSTYTEVRNSWSPTAAGSARPTYISDSGYKSKPCIRFTASNNLQKASGVNLTDGGVTKMTVMYALKVNSPYSGTVGPAFGTSNERMTLATLGDLALYVLPSLSPFVHARFPMGSTEGGQLITAVYDGTLSGDANRLKVWRNQVQESLTFTGTIPASLSSSGDALFMGIFSNATGNFPHDHLGNIGFKNVAFSDEQREEWEAWAAEEWFTKTTYSLIVDGDSNTEETSTSGNYAWPERVYDGMGWTGRYFNTASVGKTLAGMVSGGNVLDDKRDDWYATQYAVIMGGTNDIGVEGASAATLITRINSWVASRRAQRFPMIVLTCLANADMTAPMEVIRQAYNAHIMSLAASDLIAVNTDVPLPTGGAAPYYADGTHLNATGHQHLADYIIGLLEALEPPTPQPWRFDAVDVYLAGAEQTQVRQ